MSKTYTSTRSSDEVSILTAPQVGLHPYASITIIPKTISALSRLITIFYSNGSGNCKALLQYIKNLNYNLSIKYVNIDNDIMKDVIMKKFTVVPAMTVVQNDEISLYTGENVFEWFNLLEASIMEEVNHENTSDHEESPIEPQNPVSNISSINNGYSEPSKKKSILEIAAELSKARDKDK